MEPAVKTLPAIYRLKSGSPSSLIPGGWHRLSELLEAVNNLRREQGLQPMDKWDLVHGFFDLKTGLAFAWFDGQFIMHGQKSEVSEKMSFDNEELFVPAGWGVAVVEATKRGVISVFIKSIKGQLTVVGLNIINTQINVRDLCKGKSFTQKEENLFTRAS